MGVLTARVSFIFILLSVSAAVIAGATKLKNYGRTYSFFDVSEKESYGFDFEAESKISNNALQVTPDTANVGVFNLQHKSGRILIKQPFKLYDGEFDKKSTGRVASFNSSFLVNIFPQNRSVGDGLAFVIAPSLDLPLESSGEFLGLTNAFTDGNATNRLIAVELDTVKQEYDPDDNHLGLNINSVRSVVAVPLARRGILLAPVDPPDRPTPRFHNIWVNYDGIQKVISVYMAQQADEKVSTPPMPATPLIKWDLDLQQFLAQESYIGFSASTGNTYQLNCVLSWNISVNYFPGEGSPALKIGPGVGIPVAVIILAALATKYYI